MPEYRNAFQEIMSALPEPEGMTRDQQVPMTMYVTPDGELFYSPDGIGRIWYDDEDEAFEQHAEDMPRVYLDRAPEDY